MKKYSADEFVVYAPKTGDSLQQLINQLECNVQDSPQSIEGHFISSTIHLELLSMKMTLEVLPKW